MRIQWSSDAARAMLARLDESDRGLQGCLRQSALILAAIDEANKDGDDDALIKAKARFEACKERLTTLTRSLEDFTEALRKADSLFEQADEDTLRLANGVGRQAPSPPGSGMRRAVRWEPTAFAVMPQMRTRITAYPAWLEDATAAADAFLD